MPVFNHVWGEAYSQTGEVIDGMSRLPANMLVHAGESTLIVNDPDVVQEMLVTKNALIDKTGAWELIYKQFYGRSFVFSKTDDDWKVKRKATAHAFYKSRLVHMLDNLKEKALGACEEWKRRIESSETGSTDIDISIEILHLF